MADAIFNVVSTHNQRPSATTCLYQRDRAVNYSSSTFFDKCFTPSGLWRQKLAVYVTRLFWIHSFADQKINYITPANYAMGDQVVVGDIYDEEEEDSFFQDVDVLQSYGIVS